MRLPTWAKPLTAEQLLQTIATVQQYCGEDIADWSEDLSDAVESGLVHILATLCAVEAERDRLRGLLERLVNVQYNGAPLSKSFPEWSAVMIEAKAALRPAPEAEA